MGGGGARRGEKRRRRGEGFGWMWVVGLCISRSGSRGEDSDSGKPYPFAGADRRSNVYIQLFLDDIMMDLRKLHTLDFHAFRCMGDCPGLLSSSTRHSPYGQEAQSHIRGDGNDEPLLRGRVRAVICAPIAADRGMRGWLSLLCCP